MHKVEFSDGQTMEVEKMDAAVFCRMQLDHKKPIVKIDGNRAAYFGMKDEEIEKEYERLLLEKINLEYRMNCKHDKGYITNTGMFCASRCVICGKEMT